MEKKFNYYDRSKCDMLTLNPDQERELRSRIATEQRLAWCVFLFVGCLICAALGAIGDVLARAIVQWYSTAPYLSIGILAAIGGTLVAIILHFAIVRVNRKEIKLPEHLVAVEKETAEERNV